MSDRALSPVVAKTLEIGLVLLYVGFVTAGLYGGVVPHARTDAAGVVGDRVLAAAATHVEDAVPTVRATVTARERVSLPATLRGRPYSIRATNRSLVLDSPAPGVGGRANLSLPARVTAVNGTWRSDSGRPPVVVVNGSADVVRIALREGGDA